MTTQRLTDLEKNLELRYETLGKAEKRLAITDEIFSKNAIELRIREEILPEIRKYKAEYWEVMMQEVRYRLVEETEASHAIGEVIQEVQVIQSQGNCPPELMQLLLEIRDKLNQPGIAAAAKAKLALPLIPGIVSYEVELDTENLLRRVFQPLKQLFKSTLAKN